MGRLMRRGLTGDELLAEWSEADADSYEAAVAVFDHELAQGLTAVREDGGPPYEPVTELPRDADLVIVTTAMGGG